VKWACGVFHRAHGIESIAAGVEDIEICQHLNESQRDDDRTVAALLFNEA
jgi:hypothetical protein